MLGPAASLIVTFLVSIGSWIFFGAGLNSVIKKSHSPKLAQKVSEAIRKFTIFISIPAVMLVSLHDLKIDLSLLFPVSMAWIVFIVGLIFFGVFGRRMGLTQSSVGALILTAGLGNTSFVGFPLLVALQGESSLKVAILTDQPGSFLVLATLGVIAASFYSAVGANSAGKLSFKRVAVRIIKFPPIWGLIFAVLLRPFQIPAAEHKILHGLGSTLIPLALISVGSELVFDLRKLRAQILGRERALVIGLGYKLFAAPLLILLAYFYFKSSISTDVARITILEAAMAPMITGAIIARENELDPELTSLMVSIGIPMSLITVPLLSLVLDRLIFN